MSCYQKFYTNQIHSSSLLCQLATMWKSQVLCDAIIKSGTVNIKAHRVVLVAACPMLQSMENAAVGSHLEVRLASDIKQDSINAFLQYLYEGFMMLTEENCKDVEKIARLLQVDSVIKCCADFYKCLSTKTGNTDLNDPYKYTFHDMVEFRHVRSSDIQKTYQSRLVKRTSDFPRPVSPNSKRQKIHRPSSPYTGTHKPDDTISMSHGYNNASSNPWDRVPWLPASKRGHHNTPQPGVIDIVEDSLELVQTNPGSKGKGDRPQESVSVGVASSINSSSDVQIVDIVEPSGSTPFISSNTAGIGVMSQNDASVSSDRNTDSSPASLSRGSDKQSSSANRDPLERVMQSTQFSTPSHQRSDADTSISFSRSSESYSYSSPSLSMSGQRLMPNSRSFAAGSLLQSGASHGQRVSGLQPPPLSRGPKPVTHTEGSGDKDYSDRDSDDQLTDKPPDLSIVKIEAVGAESTGGLDMSVDILDDKVHSEVEHEDGSETEHDQSTDWIPEEMSNEASNVSADQNSTWYMGHSQGKGHGRLKGTKWHSVGTPSPKQAHSPLKLSSNLKSKGSYGPEVVLIDDNQPYLHFSPVDSSFVSEDSFQHDRKSDSVVKLSMYGTDVVTDPDKTLSLLSEDDFIKLESIVGSIDTVPVHFIASLQGKQKICLLCKFLGRKTNDGALSVRTRSKCLQCDIPLCKGMPRNCFRVFHKFFQLSKYPDLKW